MILKIDRDIQNYTMTQLENDQETKKFKNEMELQNFGVHRFNNFAIL